MKMNMAWRAILLSIAILFAGSAATLAQSSTGEVNGSVTDPAGAYIANAKVVLTNNATGVKRVTATNQAGRFNFSNVSTAGVYTIEVSMTGFQNVEQHGITVQVNQIVSLDYKLAVGNVEQKVEVASESEALQTSSSGLGTVIDTIAANDLPLNGHNFTQILTLTPGVTPVQNEQGADAGSSYQQDVTIPGTPTFRPNVNGQWNRSNLYYLDGLWNSTNVASGYAITPIIEAVQEFKVESHNDDAEYGGSMGGTINLVSKSGTASLHGEAWEDVRNNFFDARDPFLDPGPPGAYHQNEFGATLGGPVFVPKVYDGRKKTFFYFAYDGWRFNKVAQNRYYVPTDAELSGDFSHSIVGQNIYDPTTLTPSATAPSGYTAQQYSYNGVANVIPPGEINQMTQAFFKNYWDRPNYSNPSEPQYNVLNSEPDVNNSNTYQIKIDETLGAKDMISGRFTHFHTVDVDPITLILGTNVDRPRVNTGGDWTHQFTENIVSDFKFAYSRTPYIETTAFTTGSSAAASEGFAGIAKYGVPALELQTPWGNPGGSQNQGGVGGAAINQRDHVYQTAETVSWLKGKHFFTGGFQWIHQYYATPAYNQQFYAFNNSTTEDPNNVGKTGASLASALVGVPLGQTYIGQSWTESFNEFGAFFQDQWKVTPKLTVNVGLRYDKLAPIGNLSGTIFGGFDVNTGFYDISGTALPPQCATAKAAPCLPGALNTIPEGNHIGLAPCASYRCPVDYNLGPHVGLAYAWNAKTVVRGGYGLVYDEFAGFIQDMADHVGNWPAAQTVFQSLNGTLGQPLTYIGSLQNLNAAALPTAAPWGTLFWNADPKKQVPLSNQWNIEIQREVSRTLTVTAGYVGSSSHHLDYTGAGNQAVTPSTGTAAQVDALRPWPGQGNVYFGRSIGKSSYNSLQLSANQKMTDGLQFLISYTWSKSIDNGASGFLASENGPGGGGAGIQDYYHPDRNVGPSAFNVPQFLSTSMIYQLPFGPGRTHLQSGPASWVLGGWQTNAIFSVRSGQPYSILVNGDVANVGGTVYGIGYARANLVGDPHVAHPTKAEWFNTAAYSVPSYSYGNSPRNGLYSDHVTQFDLSAFKRIPIVKERAYLEYRAEAFNVLNIMNYAAPANTVNAAGFGTVNSLVTGVLPRELQFTLALNF